MGTQTNQLSIDEQRAHLREVVETLRDVMLGTYEQVGERPLMRSRPMHVTQLEEDGTLWFLTAMESDTAKQIRKYDGVTVTGQSGSRYVSLVGTASVVTDREKIHALWSKLDEVWFPAGPDDPNVCLVRFAPREGEYWDVSSTRGFRYLFDAAKALITKEPPAPRDDQHAKVDLQSHR